MKKIAISAIGRDRPGIVAAVTRVLFKLGGNIEDSTMTLLEDEFAMILIVSVPKNLTVENCKEGFGGVVKEMGLLIDVKEVEARAVKGVAEANVEAFIISVLGADHPGIVYEVTQLLADQDVNVTDLNSKVVEGEQGKPVYVMILEVDLPPTMKKKDLEEKLNDLMGKLKVDITIKPLETIKA